MQLNLGDGPSSANEAALLGVPHLMLPLSGTLIVPLPHPRRPLLLGLLVLQRQPATSTLAHEAAYK